MNAPGYKGISIIVFNNSEYFVPTDTILSLWLGTRRLTLHPGIVCADLKRLDEFKNTNRHVSFQKYVIVVRRQCNWSVIRLLWGKSFSSGLISEIGPH